ncbi:MAG: CBS domain-containing protein [Methanobrevibacter sp.]|uniref:CBS domain-containing protein n=1 Tax=Methanobrevibacter sp. TaxID=66852 RepID=UPI0026E0B280|nr:CBS domain-containing protein [Methanobrevibacter sp.]MDO5848093.1 CBS domain-containing protein [Methanobrevibacter sp.]
MKIKNLMTEDLITIDKDQNLTDALKLMHKHKISRLPVLNANHEHKKELVGIISERDIADKIGSAKFEKKPISRIHVSSVMVKDIITVPEDMDLIDVAKLMFDNGIGSVPVMDDENNLVGIVSKADFLTLANGKAFDKLYVKDVMSKNITSVSPDERVVHARRLMIDAKVGRLPVIENDKLVGMITYKDLIRAFLDIKKNVPENHQKVHLKELLVDEIMTPNPLSANEYESVSKVDNLMIETGFNGIPTINDNNYVVGIITQTDILGLLIELES